MSSKQNEYGEGNYEATRRYNEATKKFVDAGRVEKAAREAAPATPAEGVALLKAEQAALLRAKVQPDGTVDDPMAKDAPPAPRSSKP